MLQSTCSIPDCTNPALCRTWCKKHYSRYRTHGDPLTTKKKRYGNASCAVDCCERPRRKREWCEFHYSRWRINGSVEDEAQSWTLGERTDCIVCGDPTTVGNGFRRYCGQSCAVMASMGKRLTRSACAQCGEPIDLTSRSASGRLKYSSASNCGKCRTPGLQRNVPALIARDGVTCRICSTSMDVAVKYPDMQCISVDHVRPRSLGGPDHMDNYQLAHLLCNIKKQNKIGFTLKAA